MTVATKLTYADYLLIPEDGKRHEIIDGEHYVNASPVPRHQAVSRQLMHLLQDFLDEHPMGVIYGAPIDVLLGRHDVAVPDIIYISDGRAHIIGPKNIQGSPELIVEITSPSTRKLDLVKKLPVYERSGVSEYWIPDPATDTLTIYRLNAGKYERVAELTMADTLTTPLLPGFEAPLAKIFTAR